MTEEKTMREDQITEQLAKWKGRLERDKQAYESEITLMREREQIYGGTTQVDGSISGSGEYASGFSGGMAANVYNVAYELIEGQVDSSLPAPKVAANCKEDAEIAQSIEEMLRAKMNALPFEEFNDMDERTCYKQGGSYALVEWDAANNKHGSYGELHISGLHPLQVIPQNGVAELEDMDYVFVRYSSTRAAVEKRYGKEVPNEDEEDAQIRGADEQAEDVLTVNVAYYKNDDGTIGRYTWVNDVELEALDDYEALRVMRCQGCGTICALGETTCPECGSKKLKEDVEEYEEIMLPVKRSDGSKIEEEEPQRDDDGLPIMKDVQNPDGSTKLNELGKPVKKPVMKKTKVPRYKPGCFPLIMRRNVSKFGSHLGSSDVDVIRPQQDAIKKLMNNVLEKLLKGGSYVTLPAGVRIETSDRQLKILRIENPAQKALIDVLNIQPNINFDMAAMRDQYEKAQSTLGITNSFQGKPDSTANSGVAKQFQAAQSAGRLESKRKMKHAYYQRIFETMFKFMLAYCDEPVQFRAVSETGKEVYTEFNRYDYLKQDEAGQWYWDDNFLFSVDVTGGLAQNREIMWNEAEKKYSSGALGTPTDNETRILYWTLLEQLQFPLAKAVRQNIENMAEKPGEAKQMPSAKTVPDIASMLGGGGVQSIPGIPQMQGARDVIAMGNAMPQMQQDMQIPEFSEEDSDMQKLMQIPAQYLKTISDIQDKQKAKREEQKQ